MCGGRKVDCPEAVQCFWFRRLMLVGSEPVRMRRALLHAIAVGFGMRATTASLPVVLPEFIGARYRSQGRNILNPILILSPLL